MSTVSSVELKKNAENAITSTATKGVVAGTAGNGSVFAGKNEVGKARNTEVYNEMDTKTKQVIASTIGDKAWCNPEKIAKNLEASGVTATVGKSNGNTYLEVTNADGTKSRIWDVGSDGGIGTQDIDLTGQLKSLNNDIKASAATSTSNSTSAQSTSPISSVNNDSTSFDNNDSSNNSTADTSNVESSSKYARRYEELKDELKNDNNYKGYSDERLDEIIKEKLADEFKL